MASLLLRRRRSPRRTVSGAIATGLLLALASAPAAAQASVPAAPTGLSATPTAPPPPSTVILTWTDNASDEDRFRIERRLAGQGAFAAIGNSPPNFAFFQDLGPLEVGTTYEYRVIAENASGDSAPSDVASATTAPFAPDGAPTNLVVDVVAWNRVELAWADNATNEAEYLVRRGAFEASVPAGSTAFVDTETQGDTTYTYRVFARNVTGTSGPSNAVTVTTPPTPKPAAPTGLRVRRHGAPFVDGTTFVELSWTDETDDELFFRVDRSGEDEDLDFEQIAELPPDTTSYVDTEAKTGFAYAYRVRVRDANTISDPVTVVVPPVPEDLLVADARSLDVGDLAGEVALLSLATLGDVDGDGVADLAAGAPFDDGDAPARGAVHLFFMEAGGGVRDRVRIGATHPALGGGIDANDLWGNAVGAAGDVDGDGVPDLAVGVPGFPQATAGSVWVLRLARDGSVRGAVETVGTAIHANAFETGRSVGRAGDLDGDGRDELIVGMYDAAAILFLDATGATVASQVISDDVSYDDVDDGFDPPGNTFELGASVTSLGDLDGDGVPDVAVGNDFLGYAVWVLFLEGGGRVHAWTRIHGNDLSAGDMLTPLLGISLASLGDLDGDGMLELAVGAERGRETDLSHSGQVHLLSLAPDGTVMRERFFSSVRGGAPVPDASLLGASLAAVPDLDGDGVTDLVVGYDLTFEPPVIVSLNAGAWTDVGRELAGTGSAPELRGRGPLTPTSKVTLILEDAAPLAPVLFVIGGADASLPFKGGVLVPQPEIVVMGPATDAAGALEVDLRWPPDIPAGTTVWYQAWLPDAAGPAGFASSNAVTSETR